MITNQTGQPRVQPSFVVFCGQFVRRRMPVPAILILLIVGLVLGEASAILLGRVLPVGRAAAGTVSFTCAFVLLRITDDIDDEGGGRALWERERYDVERRLGTLGALVLAVLVVAAWFYGNLVVVVAATVATPLASFVVRPHLAGHDREPLRSRSGLATALLGIVYEGVPAAIIASLPIALVDDRVPASWLPRVVLLSELFWGAYETFKLGRALVRPGWRPYGLAERGVSACLAVLAAMSTCAVVILRWSGLFSTAVAAVLGGAFAGVTLMYALACSRAIRPTLATGLFTCLRFIPLGAVIAGTAAAVSWRLL